MNPWAIGALAWLAAVITAAAFLRWAGKRRDHGDRLAATAPAPANRPSAGAGPEPGPGTPFDPPSMTPGPGPAPVCVFSFNCYDDGHAEILDHRRHMVINVPATAAPDFDGWLEGLTP